MTLDERFKTPDGALLAGGILTDAQFAEQYGHLTSVLLRDPNACLTALATWPTPRFDRVAPTLVDRVCHTPEHAFHAGWRLPPHRFDAYSAQFVGAIAQDPDLCTKAYLLSSPNNFDNHRVALVEGVAKSPRHSFQALQSWPMSQGSPLCDKLMDGILSSPHYCHRVLIDMPHFSAYEDKLVAPLLSDPSCCYFGGLHWWDSTYSRQRGAVLKTLFTSPLWTARALTTWPSTRQRDFDVWLPVKFPVSAALSEHYFEVRAKHHRIWWSIRLRHGDEAVLAVPPPLFPWLAQAHALAKQTSCEESYFEALPRTLQDGTTREWIHTILDAFRTQHTDLERVVSYA